MELNHLPVERERIRMKATPSHSDREGGTCGNIDRGWRLWEKKNNNANFLTQLIISFLPVLPLSTSDRKNYLICEMSHGSVAIICAASR
ncbi:hypothetical protein CEXT_297291 [Caerostris extrusa]|uniref:Uncharacterized protein n=1 Tax=Caerostris extrusa TaxID=172846 RepID=A0AAV4MFU9_CAEEX|nr:hypothetical protein CEXT_297291 [Caerostris extrusa]